MVVQKRFLGLTAAHGDHDFQPVAMSERFLVEAAARHDLAVALQRQALPGEPHVFDEPGQIGGGLELPDFAVDGDLDHFQKP